jgi:hypothetical protein
MHLSSLWSLALGLVCGTSIASAKPGSPDEAADYHRACPDYKKYSTFIQYVSDLYLEALANTCQSTPLRWAYATPISTTLDILPDFYLSSSREDH